MEWRKCRFDYCPGRLKMEELVHVLHYLYCIIFHQIFIGSFLSSVNRNFWLNEKVDQDMLMNNLFERRDYQIIGKRDGSEHQICLINPVLSRLTPGRRVIACRSSSRLFQITLSQWKWLITYIIDMIKERCSRLYFSILVTVVYFYTW